MIEDKELLSNAFSRAKQNAHREALIPSGRIPLLLYGVLLFCMGTAMYLTGVLITFPRLFFGLNDYLYEANQWIVWYSGVPITLGIILAGIDLSLFFNQKRFGTPLRTQPATNRAVTVALTA